MKKVDVKRVLSLMLCVVMAFSTMACGGKSSQQEETEQTVKTESTVQEDTEEVQAEPESSGVVTILIAGESTDRTKEFAELAQQFVYDHGLNFELDLLFIPAGDWASQALLKLANGEAFSTMLDTSIIGQLVSNGMLQDVTDELEGSSLYDKLDSYSFDAFSVDGKVYAIPVGEKPNSGEKYNNVQIRQDLLEEVGMTEVSSVEDLEAFYDACIALHPDYYGYCSNEVASLVASTVSDKNMLFLDTSLCHAVFVDNDADDDKVYSYFESDEFKKTVEIARRWYEKGIISSQVISDIASVESGFLAGKGMFRNGTAGRIWENTDTIVANAPEAEISVYMIGKEMAKTSRGNYSTAFCVSAGVTNPQDYVDFWELVYESQETYNFFTYGEEGIDYTLDENDRITVLTTPSPFLESWVTCHTDYMYFSSNISDEAIEEYKAWDDNKALMKSNGFIFDTAPIAETVTQLSAVYSEYVAPVLLGISDNYDEMLNQLKAAGLDEYVAEYQRQFTEFYNNK